MGLERISQYNKEIYDKPTANIILNGERLKAFPLRSETRHGWPFLSLLFNIVLEVFVTVIGQKKENATKLKRSKIVTVTYDMILYKKNTLKSLPKTNKNLLD